jgi:hypothetical protein
VLALGFFMPCEHSKLESRIMTTTNQNQTAAGDQVIWGARAIGKAIGRTEKAAFAMLEQGSLPGARKVAGRWAFNPAVFFAAFDENAARAA